VFREGEEIEMKFCQDHWGKLKAEITSLGMGHLIAGSSQEMGAKLEAQADPGAQQRAFDPLMSAFMAITSNALDHGGMALMMALQTPPNPECPLCFLQQHHEQGCKIEGCKFTYEVWIQYAAKDACEHAKGLGLVGSA
jgi:hypothetical protein